MLYQAKVQGVSEKQGSSFPRSESSILSEYLQLSGFFILLALLLSVLSYHPTDPSDLVQVYTFKHSSLAHSSDEVATVSNLFGPLGSNLSEWLFQLMGILAPIGLVLGTLQICDSLMQKKNTAGLYFRFFGLAQFVVFGSVLLTIIFREIEYRGVHIASAGYLGITLTTLMTKNLGTTGALFMSVFGLISALPMIADVRLMTLLRFLASILPTKHLGDLSLALKETERTNDIERSEKPQPKEIFATAGGSQFVSKAMFSGHPSGHPSGRSLGQDSVHTILPRYETKKAQILNAASLLELLQNHETAGQEQRREDEKKRLVGEAHLLIEKLETFGVTGHVVRSQPGPVVNVHEFEPAAGVKVGKVLSLQEDLALGLRAKSVIMAPQSGKSTIGIELPAHYRETVSLKEVICSNEFQICEKPLKMVLGKNVEGLPLVADLSSMPHLLVAGATGSGKSVAINVILLSLLISRKPEELRLILVDPKMLELSNYDGIGHLLLPVVTQPEKAAGALKWALGEMDRRYALLKDSHVRNIESFNKLSEAERRCEKLPYIVVVIDELCDLMMTAPKEVEDSVQRLAQKARASGIHLILATQRPSVDVLTGVIKANLPCRISFQVSSKHDSRTIIEAMGAEKLLGKGDMLYLPPGTNKLMRAHGAFVSDEEVNEVCRVLRETYPARYETGVISEVNQASEAIAEGAVKGKAGQEEVSLLSEDDLYTLAVEFAVSSGKVSTSSIQRHFRIGYNKAARLMDRMDQEGLVGPSDIAGKPREVKVSR